MSGLLVSKVNEADCVLTDGNKTVVELLQENVDRLNKDQPRGEGKGSFSCCRLKWGAKYAKDFLAPHPQLSSGFDLIIGKLYPLPFLFSSNKFLSSFF